MFGKPPEIIPDGLSAGQLLELADWYFEKRMLAQARQALARAMELDPEEPIKRECLILLARVPKNAVPKEVAERIFTAQTELRLKPGEARKKAEKILAEYPDFEAARRLVAEAAMHMGELDRAIETLEHILDFNPEYAPALALMARALTIDMEYERAYKFLQKAERLMPDDAELASLRRSLDFLVSLEAEVA